MDYKKYIGLGIALLFSLVVCMAWLAGAVFDLCLRAFREGRAYTRRL